MKSLLTLSLTGAATRIWSQFCHLDVLCDSLDDSQPVLGLALASPDAEVDE